MLDDNFADLDDDLSASTLNVIINVNFIKFIYMFGLIKKQ